MNSRNFRQMLEKKWAEGKFVCVGLDPDIDNLPGPLRLRYTEYSPTTPDTQFSAFCKAIVNATKDLVCAYKLDLAFFVALADGALWGTINYIHRVAPDVPVILDAKYGGAIAKENVGYVRQAFGYLKADGVTVNPYTSAWALQPFLDCKDKGIFVLCRTSEPGSDEFQYLPVGDGRLYGYVANHVAYHWNKNGNCGLVVGANRPEELKEVRERAPDVPILSPAIGFQQEGVSLEKQVEQVVSAGKYGHELRLLISASRSIILASSGADFDEAARHETLKLHTLVNQYR